MGQDSYIVPLMILATSRLSVLSNLDKSVSFGDRRAITGRGNFTCPNGKTHLCLAPTFNSGTKASRGPGVQVAKGTDPYGSRCEMGSML